MQWLVKQMLEWSGQPTVSVHKWWCDLVSLELARLSDAELHH
jgi:hypothetical protein